MRGKRYALAAVVLVTACIGLQTAGASARPKPKPRADLVETQLVVTPASVAPGATFTAADTAANRGRAVARASTVSFALGTSSLGSRHVSALKKRRSSSASTRLQLPAGLGAGTYSVTACADARRAVKESNERNNCRSATLTVTAPPVVPPPPPPPAPPADSDGDGYPDNVDCAPHDPSIHPGAPDKPDLSYVDSNCDGIDGTASQAIFVSPAGNDASVGTMSAPMRTLSAAIAAAVPAGKDVYATSGLYTEAAGYLTVPSHTALYGGYTGSWSRPSPTATAVTGSPQAVLANGATGVTLQLVTLSATAPAGAASCTYGIRAIAGSSIVLQGVTITAGDATAGAAGANGTTPAAANNGAPGGGGTCDSNIAGAPGGAGGTSAAGRTGGAGGKGGDYGANAGSSGGAGVGGALGGSGGAGGNPGHAGGTGSPGAAGATGSNGNGATFGIDLAGATWAGHLGFNGATGSHGNGGGGGGGGGGQGCTLCDDGNGNGGGGGGAGGLASSAGGGGGSGGGSFGIYLQSSTVTVEASSITAGKGGAGGVGGDGVAGGQGGSGGAGGTVCTGEVGAGGAGGHGGQGGASGGGGGGPGGPSIVIFRGGGSTATVAGSTLIPGTPGSGGNGGASGGGAGAGGKGADGIAAQIYPG